METLNGESICYWIVPLQDTLSKRMCVSKEELGGGGGMLRKDLYKANAGSSPPTAGKSVLRNKDGAVSQSSQVNTEP